MSDSTRLDATGVATTVAPTIRPSFRFRVLHRDGFRCRYCGRTAADGVTLEADHIIPRSRGGADSMDNMVTACFDCNRGKSARPLQPIRESQMPRGRRKRHKAAPPPPVEKPWPIGSHCATPLKVAVIAHQLGFTDYRAAWVYFSSTSAGAILPPHRMSDAGWLELVKSYGFAA